MKKILIYCPNIGYHRQIYCNVLADWALNRGYFVYIVFGGTHYYVGSGVSKTMKYLKSPYIDYYKNKDNVKLINILNEFNNLPLEEEFKFIAKLQKELRVDTTVLADGMDHIDRLFKLRKKKTEAKRIFHSKTICLNLGTAFFYMNIIQRYFGLRKFKKIDSLDKIIIFDEFLYNKIKSDKFGFIPDICKSFNVTDDKTYDKKIMGNYKEFCIKNNSKEIIFYFGQSDFRKGYDTLLKLVLQNKDLVFVHCGELTQFIKENFELNRIIQQLMKEERIFMVDMFVTSDKMISEFFDSIDFMVSGHRNYPLTSGVMIQALMHNKPLIVPNNGLMPRRVKENKLGLVYEHCSINDLNKKVILMSKEYKQYLNAVKEYKDNYSKRSIFSWFDKDIQ